MTDNNSDSIGQGLGASANAETGSRERGQEVVPALSGIDPARKKAFEICEAFVGQVLVAREIHETVARRGEWQRLKQSPVRSIDFVDDDRAAYEIDIDSRGDAWVRFTGNHNGDAEIRYTAGLAAEYEDVPEPLKQGVDRLAAHIAFEPEREPPAAVTALWRPYRRVRL